MSKYDIAAYIWPAYTGDEPRSRIFWPEGIGEWQTVKNSVRKENGYYWNRKPVWGYVNEADPFVMAGQINAALAHGVNVFIYDWYWYDNRPFLEQCLDNGFLKAPNNGDMKFYIMWANHDANTVWDKRIAGKKGQGSNVWQGAVDRTQFEIIGKRWIDMYFTRPNYYRIDGKPVVSIYDLNNFVNGLGGVEKAKEALIWLENEAVKAGLTGVHFQFIRWSGRQERNLTGVDGGVTETGVKLIEELGFDSLTHYQFVHFAAMDRDYTDVMVDVEKEWAKMVQEYKVPYYPHVSIGWDNNPRFEMFWPGTMNNCSPAHFENALRKAKAFADKTNVKLITVNSWNEWTESSYLEPDNVDGYGYLEAVKKVFVDEE
ncbi:MAG: hypothetical protein E7588_09195 [Ruminococcaceae bacterium]|nr:hypothetical protein [Oscillospiraceae bacterium]